MIPYCQLGVLGIFDSEYSNLTKIYLIVSMIPPSPLNSTCVESHKYGCTKLKLHSTRKPNINTWSRTTQSSLSHQKSFKNLFELKIVRPNRKKQIYFLPSWKKDFLLLSEKKKLLMRMRFYGTIKQPKKFFLWVWINSA